MEQNLPQRKRIRLPEFDYNSNGVYFITFCTQERAKVLSNVRVGATIGRPPIVALTDYGRIVEEAIRHIPDHYPMITADNYVIMPNHVHLLLFLYCDSGRPMTAPTISRVINQLKGSVTKRIGKPIWQKSFYDHIIRNEDDYRSVREYIDSNPARWTQDEILHTVTDSFLTEAVLFFCAEIRLFGTKRAGSATNPAPILFIYKEKHHICVSFTRLSQYPHSRQGNTGIVRNK